MTIEAEVTRVTMRGRSNHCDVEHGVTGWRITGGGRVISGQTAWEHQSQAMNVATKWLMLHDEADELRRAAAVKEREASALMSEDAQGARE